jgi:hypothetical protein
LNVIYCNKGEIDQRSAGSRRRHPHFISSKIANSQVHEFSNSHHDPIIVRINTDLIPKNLFFTFLATQPGGSVVVPLPVILSQSYSHSFIVIVLEWGKRLYLYAMKRFLGVTSSQVKRPRRVHNFYFFLLFQCRLYYFLPSLSASSSLYY